MEEEEGERGNGIRGYGQGRHTYVHLGVEVGHSLIVSWEVVELNSIGTELLHYLAERKVCHNHHMMYDEKSPRAAVADLLWP